MSLDDRTIVVAYLNSIPVEVGLSMDDPTITKWLETHQGSADGMPHAVTVTVRDFLEQVSLRALTGNDSSEVLARAVVALSGVDAVAGSMEPVEADGLDEIEVKVLHAELTAKIYAYRHGRAPARSSKDASRSCATEAKEVMRACGLID